MKWARMEREGGRGRGGERDRERDLELWRTLRSQCGWHQNLNQFLVSSAPTIQDAALSLDLHIRGCGIELLYMHNCAIYLIILYVMRIMQYTHHTFSGSL